jgi:CRP-like cAMP-binding protein
MVSIQDLIQRLEAYSQIVNIGANEYFDFKPQEQSILIEQGELLIIGPKDPKTGRSGRQTFKENDPIGFAESIAMAETNYESNVLSDLRLRIFDGAQIRNYANKAGVFSRTIIRYSIGRIFDGARKDSKASIVFEDEFIFKNYDELRKIEIAGGTEIFKAGADADKMYFVESGTVSVSTAQNKLIATLGAGECFGEAALLGEEVRNATVSAETDVNLVAIEKKLAEAELSNGHPMTQLATLMLLKQLGLMNQLKGMR